MSSWRRCGSASIADGLTAASGGLSRLRSGLGSNSRFADRAGLERKRISDVPFVPQKKSSAF